MTAAVVITVTVLATLAVYAIARRVLARREATRLEREWIAFRDAPRPQAAPLREIAPGIVANDDEVLIVMHPRGLTQGEAHDDD